MPPVVPTVEVGLADFYEAIDGLTPSVGPDELERYKAVHKQFNG